MTVFESGLDGIALGLIYESCPLLSFSKSMIEDAMEPMSDGCQNGY